MTKVIVSHDVDHLYASDHWFRDLTYPKLWVRSSIQLIKREITLSEWFLRVISCFKMNRNNIIPLMDFDRQHGIKSTFFFGMASGLGMSYKPEKARSVMQFVKTNGFPIGVHGIEYRDIVGMKEEYLKFEEIVGEAPRGIRMHYVRFDDDTFKKLDDTGYLFDSTEYDKTNPGLGKEPYKINNMWEFPLTIMDVDPYMPQNFAEAKKRTLEILDDCKANNIGYISILFHDYRFCNAYQDIMRWYVWLVEYLEGSDDYDFISYDEAITLLEGNKNGCRQEKYNK